MGFAEKLKNALTALGVTQAELSKRTGINKAIISEYLSGKYEPKQKNLFKIATALSIKPSALIPDFIEPAASVTPKKRITLSRHDRSMVEAYQNASDTDKKTVDMILNEYTSDDLPELAEKEKEEMELDFVG